jgi:lipopolysaccharide/colanic/teichoic acid biosynthesis glycosyltransferase
VLTTSRWKATPRPTTDDLEFASGWFFSQEQFLRMLVLERKRTERSRRPFVLMLLEAGGLLRDGADKDTIKKVLATLFRSTRDTDIKGWYKADSTIGVIFADMVPGGDSVGQALLAKILDALGGALSGEQIKEIRLSLHHFPETEDAERPGGQADSILYPELPGERDRKSAHRIVKRAMDIAGSIAALIVSFPLTAAIALLVKLTSKGPVLFRQDRVGLDGRTFTFLKFRSMYVSSDPTIHEDYVKALILGTNVPQGGEEPRTGVYKLTRDPRVTPIGRFLRRTSLDELPQFLNVLKGEMSLVGPRPAIPYEIKSYDLWHRRRVLKVKPGITGLWQVEGRSRVTFNEMVRLDLRYVKSWSPLLDLKILLRTPKAVVSGSGAY